MIRNIVAVGIVTLALSSTTFAAETTQPHQGTKVVGPYQKFSSLEEEKAFLEKSIVRWQDEIKRNPREATPEDHEQLRVRKARLKQVSVLLEEKNKK